MITIDISTTSNEYLTCEQLDNRLKKYRSVRLTCENLNNERNIKRLGKTSKLHEHFLYFIKEMKIHNLHKLVNVALRNKRRISYIIEKWLLLSKVCTIQGILWTIKNWLFLILHYGGGGGGGGGGAGLIDIVYKAIKLSSASTSYRLLISSRPIKLSTDVISNVVVDNANFDNGGSLKHVCLRSTKPMWINE